MWYTTPASAEGNFIVIASKLPAAAVAVSTTTPTATPTAAAGPSSRASAAFSCG